MQIPQKMGYLIEFVIFRKDLDENFSEFHECSISIVCFFQFQCCHLHINVLNQIFKQIFEKLCIKLQFLDNCLSYSTKNRYIGCTRYMEERVHQLYTVHLQRLDALFLTRRLCCGRYRVCPMHKLLHSSKRYCDCLTLRPRNAASVEKRANTKKS